MVGCTGLSPRVRGETFGGFDVRTAHRVYPRVCGGNRSIAPTSPSCKGLSPRVRGKRCRYRRNAVRAGSIPACAGETRRGADCGADDGVYPRVCGGNLPALVMGFVVGGLSPRVRGKRSWGGIPGAAGSIPACAGETTAGNGYRLMMRVYPRVCGGNLMFAGQSRIVRGLSPRVRGKLEMIGIDAYQEGSIPACAGETPRRL